MSEDTALLEKQSELKGQLAAGEYRTLIDAILDEMGRLIQKLIRSPEPMSFGYSAVLVALVTLLLGLLPSLAFGELGPGRREEILGNISMVAIALAAIIIAKIAQDILLATLRDHFVDALESVADLADLQRWLAAHYDMRRQFWFSLAYCVLMTSYSVVTGSMARGGFVGVGTTVLSAITSFQNGMLLYLFLPIVTFCARLGHYQIKLFAADPGSSEIISHLSDMIGNEAFIGVALSAISTLVYALLGQLTLMTAVALVIVAWSPCIIVFASGQRALTKAIARVRWRTLNDVQDRIETLAAEGDIVDKSTTDAINRLMDLHERIKATRSSALDLGAGLKFLNSLLLPLIAFLLSNLDRVLNLFR